MRHTITISSNPRILLLIFIVIALPAAGALLLIFAGILIGIIALAGAAYLDYQMLRFFRNHIKSWVETTETDLKCRMPDGELLEFAWKTVSAAGYCTQERGRSFLFVYRAEGDKLVTIPNEYSDFGTLLATIRERTSFMELSLGQSETIQERLKVLLDINTPEEEKNPD